MVTRENVGTEILASDAQLRNSLKRGPPLSVKQNLVVQPVRNMLLADFQLAAGSSQLGCELGLPAGNLDCPLQNSNVVLLHENPKYTNRLVFATNPFVRQDNKEVCTVLEMTTHSRNTALRRPTKPVSPRTPRRKAVPGPDGKTLGQRLREAMAHESGRRGREYLPVDLLTDISRLAGRSKDNPLITQQMLSAILRDTVTKTTAAAFLAHACHVNPLWLGEGVGKMLDH